MAVGVKKTGQVDSFELRANKSHVLVVLKLPGPSLENETWPVGRVAPVVAVSVTFAVHQVPAPTATGELQDTTVIVGSVMTVWVTLAP